MTETAVEDVVVFRVDKENGTIESWGRDTLKVATAYCARPLFPADKDETFIAVDDWGHGNVVAAHHSMKAWIGWSLRAFIGNTRVTRK